MSQIAHRSSKGKKVIKSLLVMLITTLFSAGLAWLISLIAPPFNPLVNYLLNILSLPETALWQLRFWQLVTFLVGFLFSTIVGLLLNPRKRRNG